MFLQICSLWGGTHCWDTFEARANLIFRFVWADLLRFQRVFDCLENKDDPLSTSWKLSKIPQLLPPFFFSFPSGKDEAKTASSRRLFWKTTTLRSRTPSTRAGTWLSHARGARGRPPRPSSTRGRPTSWSAYPGGTCWARGDRLMSFLSPSPCTLWASGLNIPITSAQGAAEDWNHWGRTVDGPAAGEPLQEKWSAPREINFYSQVPIHFLPHFVDLCNSLYWIVCKHWLSNLLVIFNSDRL